MLTYDRSFNNVLNIKTKTKVCFGIDQFRSTVHAFLGAYYLKNKNQGKELCTPFHY